MTSARDLKKRIDIIEVLSELGAKFEWPAGWDEEVKVFCPFCEDRDSNRPAGSAHPIKQVYHCFSCGVGGDIVSLAAYHLGEDVTFKQVLDWLDGTFPSEAAYA